MSKTAEEFIKEYYQLDKSGVESISIKSAVIFAERYAEQLNKPCVIGSLRFTANDVDGAYFIGVFNSGGIDRLSEELARIKKLGIMPHQMLDIMKRSEQ